MSTVRSIGTYLPPWGMDTARVCGRDEDAVTLAVAAGRAALEGVPNESVDRVVFVTRQPPLVEGGNGAALLAGLGLPATIDVVERLGGGPAALESLVDARTGTLVIGADVEDRAGAAAAVTGTEGATLVLDARVNRSLPVRARGLDGTVHLYDDPRLVREQGALHAVTVLGTELPVAAVAGLSARDAATLTEPDAPSLPTLGASAPLFALAALAEQSRDGVLLAVEQASAAAAAFVTDRLPVHRCEPAAGAPLVLRDNPGPEIAIALAGYDRAFDPKLRLEAARCTTCGTLSYPPRLRCLTCGSEAPTEVVALPRDCEVYTTTTIRVPVPSLATPYSLAIVELGDTEVRLLVHVTGTPPGEVRIGDRGALVFRLVAERSGVPDYGYAFLPDDVTRANEEVRP
jgi:uncharacterized OB-fold protein